MIAKRPSSPPSDLAPYTAIVSGENGANGVGLVEVHNLVLP